MVLLNAAAEAVSDDAAAVHMHSLVPTCKVYANVLLLHARVCASAC
jgi:hypothetical protein